MKKTIVHYKNKAKKEKRAGRQRHNCCNESEATLRMRENKTRINSICGSKVTGSDYLFSRGGFGILFYLLSCVNSAG